MSKLHQQSSHPPNTADLEAVISQQFDNMGQKIDVNSKFTLLPVKISVKCLNDHTQGLSQKQCEELLTHPVQSKFNQLESNIDLDQRT